MGAQRNVVREAWKADRERYPRLAFVFERSIWAVGVLRFGQWVDSIEARLPRLIGRIAYQVLFIIAETLTGISIPKSVVVGPGLRIFHSGGIVIHERAQLGANCTLRHGVTIGIRSANGGVPVIGDNVDIGACAMILGGITVGDHAKIGAGAMVQVDVPVGAIAYAPRAVISEATRAMATESKQHPTPRSRRKTVHASGMDEGPVTY
jgi:serine O-acetyltransferase